MSSTTSARVAGALFVLATAAGVIGAILIAPLGPATTAQEIAERAGAITAGGVLILVMLGAITFIAPALYPVLGAQNASLAAGYLAARLLEVVLLLPSALAPLLLVSLATGPESEQGPLGGVRVLAEAYKEWGLGASQLFFCVSVVILNAVLWRARLVPRWLPGWALVAVVPYAADACLVMGGVITASSGTHGLLVAALALSEMALAGWMLVKGFRSADMLHP
ncbi:DUF4386 domain-containing protein [Longispora albida]|uniref:DUF4386 domain-containing protein n=1 Tax=Longispora albida TaxID=203523 RepID=UPI000399AAA4|nr:DUF4386 domain-containing protein [Longispora albida]